MRLRPGTYVRVAGQALCVAEPKSSVGGDLPIAYWPLDLSELNLLVTQGRTDTGSEAAEREFLWTLL
ncbi:hypothetical protein R1flu_008703 [Riccia fluitans]|uniref:Uncharacterized protein n=1 Tax=Riccia fluitans TaxID=41844 RepID=A0ABD1YCH4_9MARC